MTQPVRDSDRQAIIDYLRSLEQRPATQPPPGPQQPARQGPAAPADRYTPGGSLTGHVCAHMSCHGADVRGRRYENERELAQLHAINFVATAAVPLVGAGTRLLTGAAAAARTAPAATAAAPAARNAPRTLELFAGARPQEPGAIGLDLALRQGGVVANTQALPFANASMRTVVASGPQAPFLAEAARVLEPGGRLIINATKGNKFGRLPPAAELERMGLRVVQEAGPMTPQHQNMVANGSLVFRRTDGSVIPPQSIRTHILERLP